jgi:hypothetical protein
MSLWEQIDGRDRIERVSGLDKPLQIAGEHGRLTRDVGDLLCTEGDKVVDRFLLGSGPWRVEQDEIDIPW